jgi:hypothetical protein
MNETPTPQGQSRSETGATESDEQIASDSADNSTRNCTGILDSKTWHSSGHCTEQHVLSAITRANKARDEQSAPAAEQIGGSVGDYCNAPFEVAPSPAQEKPPSCERCDGQGWYAHGETNFPQQIQCEACNGTGLAAQQKSVEASVPDIAQNITAMIIAYVEGGLRLGTDWRNGLQHIIRLRLERLLATASPSEDTKLIERANELLVILARQFNYNAPLPPSPAIQELGLAARELEKTLLDAAMSSPSVTQTESSLSATTPVACKQPNQETDGA